MIIKICMLLGAIALVSSVALWPFQINQVSANGGTRLIVKDEKSGAYLFRVGILPGSPKVGNLHLSVIIHSAEGDVPIDDARLVITATGPEAGITTGAVLANSAAQTPQEFDADINLTAIGSWTMTMTADSSLGMATLIVPLEVTESGGFNLIIVVVIVALVVIIASLVRSRTQKRGKPA